MANSSNATAASPASWAFSPPADAGELALALPQVLMALAARTATALGAASARGLCRLAGPAAAQQSFLRREEAEALRREGIALPLAPEQDVAVELAAIERGATLEGVALRALAGLCAAALDAAAFARTHGAQAPATAALARLPAEQSQALATVRAALRDALDSEGRLLDEASAELLRLRHAGRSVRQRIRSTLETMMVELDVAPLLQDQFVALRHERHCLPVVASFQSKMDGIVHGASQTGQTLFVEPAATVAMGNEAAVLDAAAQQEEQRILAALSAEIGAVAPVLRRAREQLAVLDVVQATAQLAAAARLHSPAFGAPGSALALRGLRHPLLALAGSLVVGNDLTLRPGQALIISGPNAGGKTAVLTACGLAHAMAQRGLPIAADAGSALPWFEGSATALGDGQSLQEGLSSFSAHLRALDGAYRAAGPGWLVLVDEIGAATDPSEGAAIAQATMQLMLEAGATLLVSTHLAALKTLPLLDARFVNARMAFDARSLRPTYRLEMGSSGQSFALDAAERLPMAPVLLQRARQLLAGQTDAVDAALKKLESEQAALAEVRLALASEQQGLRLERARLVREQAAQEAANAQTLAHALEEAAASLQAQLQAFVQTRDAARLQAAIQAVRGQAREQRHDAARRQTGSGRAPTVAEAAGPRAPASGDVQVGQVVFVASLGQSAEVLQLEAEAAVVAVGPMRMRVARAELRPSQGRLVKPRGGVRVHVADGPAPFAADAVRLRAPGRIDVRGLRSDAAMRELERAIDLCLSEGADALWVVHGHGTGALRAQVREWLDACPQANGWRRGEPHEGGDGVTIATVGDAL